jgi:hypothetical protein
MGGCSGSPRKTVTRAHDTHVEDHLRGGMKLGVEYQRGTLNVSGATGCYAHRVNGRYEADGWVDGVDAYRKVEISRCTMWLCRIAGDGRWVVQKEKNKGAKSGYALSVSDSSCSPAGLAGWHVYTNDIVNKPGKLNNNGWERQNVDVVAQLEHIVKLNTRKAGRHSADKC